MAKTSPTQLTTITLRLPWPPAINHYWRHVVIRGSVRVLLSAAGRRYRDDVLAAVLDQIEPAMRGGRLAVSLEFVMPDRRKRDIDGVIKAVLDAMQHACVYVDDNQIDHLIATRLHVESPGCVDVVIEELAAADAAKERER
jgi:crossover junction endodeoxyribonuclease RusA